MGARGPMAYPVSSDDKVKIKSGGLREEIKQHVHVWKEAEMALQTLAMEEDKRLKAGEIVPEELDTAMHSAARLQSKAMDALLERRSKSLIDVVAKLNVWFANDLGSATDVSNMTLSERLACQAIRELNAMTGFSETLE